MLRYDGHGETIMSDECWNSLTEKFPLPEKARNDFEFAIAAYRNAKEEAEITPGIRKNKFNTSAANAGDLASSLAGFGYNDWYELSNVENVDVENVSKRLEVFQAECLWLQRSLLQARAKMPAGKRNKNPQPLRDFFNLVDTILIDYTGSGLKTSNSSEKRFLFALCAVADNSIGPGSISGAIEFIVAHRANRPPWQFRN